MKIINPKSITDPKLNWFREARFGMFIHFGLYAIPGRGEWVQYDESIPPRKYEKLMRQFNPVRFNADQWIDVAEKAGCRYIILTAKHHDGFCLFGSSLTDFNITKTPFKRDLVAELVAACHRRGMRICLYYSQPDWHHPNFVHLPGAFKDLSFPLPGHRPDWAKYVEYYHGQVKELCTRYDRIDGIWFDGSHKSETQWQGRKIYNLIKKYQPGAIVNDRARYGDLFTPERSLPEDLTGYMFEACQAVAMKHWGYDPHDALYSLPALLENLVRVVAKGGNFLLNVGPMPNGVIPEAQASRMEAIGRWLDVHGESVFDTQAGGIETGSKDIVATRKGNTLYLFLCRWPDGDRLVIPGIHSKPSSVQLLAGSLPVAADVTPAGLELRNLPMAGPDPALNVLRLRFAVPPRVDMTKPAPLPRARTIRMVTRGVTLLSVADAGISGFGVKGVRLHCEHRSGKNPAVVVCNWTTDDQRLTWSVNAPKAGSYAVRIRLGCPARCKGSRYVIRGELGCLEGMVKATKSFEDYRWQNVGRIKLPEGISHLTLHPTDMPYGYLFAHIASLSLERVG